MIKENFIKLFENSFKENWDKPALYDYLTGIEKSYGEMATKIARLHALYEKLKIRPGDKIALSGKNSSSWAIVFMATVTYGAVIVPVLEEFNHNDITHVLNHSVLISGVVRDAEGRTVDYLIHSNTSDVRDFPVSIYPNPRQMLVRILGRRE